MKNVLVYGSGRSGKSAAKLLKRNGINCIIYDENKDLNKDAFYEANPDLEGVEMALGKLDGATVEKIDTVVLSPGVSLDNDNVIMLSEMGKEIIGEIELGYIFEKGRVVAITGTNGKTTTTSLTGHILRSAFKKVFVAGNIGDPYTDICDSTDEDSVTVLEVSSFQLETAKTFKPFVSAILNITPDHLNRHKTMENYIAIKESVTKNQGGSDYCILNKNDKELYRFSKESPSYPIMFSIDDEDADLFYKEGSIFYNYKDETKKIIDVSDLQILGEHNFENVMAAVGMCLQFGLSLEEIAKQLSTFTAVEHRIEFVCEKNGVRFYNDSKATNTDAAIKGLDAMPGRTVLIAGGYDKGSDYTDWVKLFKTKVSHLILIGVTAKSIAASAKKEGFDDYSFAPNLKEAVVLAKNMATKGESVLLSPACASWDQFKDFEERGRLFKEYVREL